MPILDVAENRLASFPRAVLGLKNLKEMILDENDIGSLPAELFSSLSKLEELHAMGTRTTELSEHVSKLQKLRVLNLSYNLIELLPKELAQCDTLQVLNLAFNPLYRYVLMTSW